ncbi:hypothetical protein [Streptomyces sp. NPDC001404]|uniref:hypothetical protein n=1 Tax=Streptomyces sp. NPDC001404 TaxID=3364571 RepID=UPI00367927C8
MAHWDYTLTATFTDGGRVELLPGAYWTHALDAATEDDVKQQVLADLQAQQPDVMADATITNFRANRRA